MKLSTRKKLTVALGVSCALMMLFLLLQRQLGLGSAYSTLPNSPAPVELAIEAPQSEFKPDMSSEMTFLEINDRSLFTQTRTAPAKAAPAVAQAAAEIPKVPLTAQLTGVVITPTRKVALLRSAGGDQTYRLREGMPFPGELAGWRVTQINARSVVFDGGASQGQVELKLDVAKGSPMSGSPSGLPSIPQVPGNSPVPPMSDNSKFNSAAIAMPASGAPPPPPPPPSADQAAREMEVQRIIEERRAQMRAEAERMSSGNQ